MKTTTMVMLGLLAAFSVADGGAATDTTSPGVDGCEPFWIDSNGNPQVNPDCIGPVPTAFGDQPS